MSEHSTNRLHRFLRFGLHVGNSCGLILLYHAEELLDGPKHPASFTPN